MSPGQHPAAQGREQGFALIALVILIFVILLVLGIAAPSVARDLRRERELEAVHRGNQYVRAIQLYYKKFGRYPGSIEQLEKTNNIRFLRKQYDDPLTGKPDWRLILVGQNKTTVKGLFGQPLAGLPSAGAGGIGGSNPGSAAGGFGGSSSSGSSPGGFGANTNANSAGSSFGGSSTASPTTGVDPTAPTTAGGNGIASQSATGFSGGGGPFMGVGNAKTGDSILTLNEQTDYGTWEFLYDPRIEQLKAASNLFGGGAATSATSSSLGIFGASPGGTSPGGTSPAGASPTDTTKPTLGTSSAP